jgi:hypothetical protein
MHKRRPAAAVYLRFVAGALGTILAVALVGFLPTRALAGTAGLIAMSAACTVTLVASAVAAVPLARMATRGDPRLQPAGILLALGARFGLVLAAVVPVLLMKWFARDPFLLWIALSYLAVLVVETRFTIASVSGA